ncbi:MAG: type II secretion system F family protein [Solirubrobacteraceae bacterium]
MAEPAGLRRRRFTALLVVALLSTLAGAGAATVAAKASTSTAQTATTTATRDNAATATAATKTAATKTAATKTAATTTAATTTSATKTAATTTAATTTAATKAAAGTHTSAATKPSTRQKPSKPKKAVAPLIGWLAGGTTFPARALVLEPPVGETLASSQIQVAENGTAVGSFTLTRVAQAADGDFGIVVAVDQSSTMNGVALTAAMSALKSLAKLRSGAQQLGLVTFAFAPTVVLPLTSSVTEIHRQLESTPWTSAGSDPTAAIKLALGQLTQAKLALGAVVVISDGGAVRAGSASGGSALAVAQTSAATGTQLFTIGIHDAAATATSMRALQQAAPGTFKSATAQTLTSVLDGIYESLQRDYVVRYHSSAGTGQTVSVAAVAKGIPGTVRVAYTTPKQAVVHAAAPATPAGGPSRSEIAVGAPLADLPGFADLAAVQTPAPNKGFWASSAAVPVVAGIVALLLAAALAIALHRPTRRAIRTRVGSFIPVAGEPSPDAPQERRGRRGPLTALSSGSWWPSFVAAVAISRSRYSPADHVKRAAAIAVVSAVFFMFVVGSLLLGIVTLLAWPFVLRAYVKRAAEKQRAKFRDMLPSYLQDLASSIRIGRSFVSALSAVASSADEPTRSELERATTDESLGRPLEECLEAVARRMDCSDMDQVAVIAGLARRSGSNVAESLDRVAEGSRERADVRREMRALTAQAKMSSMVLSGLPVCLLLGMSVMAPQYARPLLHTTFGIVCLALGAGLLLIGWKVMQKITDVGEF